MALGADACCLLLIFASLNVRAGRPNRFTFIEARSDMKSRQAHAAASHTIAFRNELKPVERPLYDERSYGELR
jgi:quinol monooxygenase YgiN